MKVDFLSDLLSLFKGILIESKNLLLKPFTKDILALILCAIIFWGGTILWIYSAVFILDWSNAGMIWVVAIIVSGMINAGLPGMGTSRGLYYLDKGNNNVSAWYALTGPPGMFRILAILMFFLLRIKAKDAGLIDKPVKRWDSISPWATFLKEKATNYKPKTAKEFRKRLWKIANKRIEIL